MKYNSRKLINKQQKMLFQEKKKETKKNLPSRDFPLILETKISAIILNIFVRSSMVAHVQSSGKQ